MIKSIHWDIYTILMVALVPVLLLSAAGLYFYDKNKLHNLQCEMAVEWLETSEQYSAQFVSAGTMGRTELWITTFEEIESPSKAGNLRWGILQSANYNQEHRPDLSTSERGVLNPPNGLFEQQIENGVEDLVKHCPETESMIPGAFPMVFREDEL